MCQVSTSCCGSYPSISSEPPVFSWTMYLLCSELNPDVLIGSTMFSASISHFRCYSLKTMQTPVFLPVLQSQALEAPTSPSGSFDTQSQPPVFDPPPCLPCWPTRLNAGPALHLSESWKNIKVLRWKSTMKKKFIGTSPWGICRTFQNI